MKPNYKFRQWEDQFSLILMSPIWQLPVSVNHLLWFMAVIKLWLGRRFLNMNEDKGRWCDTGRVSQCELHHKDMFSCVNICWDKYNTLQKSDWKGCRKDGVERTIPPDNGVCILVNSTETRASLSSGKSISFSSCTSTVVPHMRLILECPFKMYSSIWLHLPTHWGQHLSFIVGINQAASYWL